MKKIALLLLIVLAGSLSCSELFFNTYNVRFEVESTTSGAEADIDWDIVGDYESDGDVLPDTTLPWSDEKSVEVDRDGGQAYITVRATNSTGSMANIQVSIYVDDELVDYQQGTIANGSSEYASYSIYEY
jgi:hypothetical protein